MNDKCPKELCRFVNVHCVRSFYKLNGVSFVLSEREMIGISCDMLSTEQCLIDLLLRKTMPTSGSIQWGGGGKLPISHVISTDCRGLVSDLSISENLSMSSFHNKLFYSKRKANRLAEALLKEYNLDYSVQTPVYSIPLMDRYILNILCAVNSGAQILILTNLQKIVAGENIVAFHRVINKLQNRGITFVISESLNYVFPFFSFRVLRFEQGQMVRIWENNAEFREFQLTRSMSIIANSTYKSLQTARLSKGIGKYIRIFNIRTSSISEVDLWLRPGEVCYICGNNRYEQEMIDALFSEKPHFSIDVSGAVLHSCDISKLIAHGIGYFPQEIQSLLFPDLYYTENQNMLVLSRISYLSQIIRKSMDAYLGRALGKADNVAGIMAMQSYENQLKCCIQRYLLMKWKLLVIYLPSFYKDQTESILLKEMINTLSETGCVVLVIVSFRDEVVSAFDSFIEFDENGCIRRTLFV